MLSRVRNAALKVYEALGHGHTELVYTRAVASELCRDNLGPDSIYEFGKRLPVRYNDNKVGYVIPDLIMDGKMPVDFKVKEHITAYDVSQVSKYMKLLKYDLGLLINFTQLSRRRISNNYSTVDPSIQIYCIETSSSKYGTIHSVEELYK